MIYTLVRRDSSNNINSIISFDSITSFDESWAATVTTQTVEYGFNVTDNINIEAPTYSIDAVISSYSLFDRGNEIVWDGEDFNVSSENDTERHIKARDEIIRIFKERSILTLIESGANSNNENLDSKYSELTSGYFNETPNCVITSLGISHPNKGTGAFYVTMKVQKINVAMVTAVELTKEEMSPTLKGMVVTPTVASSKSKTVDGEEIPEGAVAQQDGDVKKTSIVEGDDWFDVYNERSKELDVIRDADEAQQALNDYMSRHPDHACKLVQVSNGFYKRCYYL